MVERIASVRGRFLATLTAVTAYEIDGGSLRIRNPPVATKICPQTAALFGSPPSSPVQVTGDEGDRSGARPNSQPAYATTTVTHEGPPRGPIERHLAAARWKLAPGTLSVVDFVDNRQRDGQRERAAGGARTAPPRPIRNAVRVSDRAF